jgi:transposase-like protein
MDRSEKFRTAAARHNKHRSANRWRYPEELKTLAVEHCQDSRLAGQSYSKIAESLGVTPLTLSRWLEATRFSPVPWL